LLQVKLSELINWFVVGRWAIADGDGHKAKPFKMEWATTKDGLLFLGSSGIGRDLALLLRTSTFTIQLLLQLTQELNGFARTEILFMRIRCG